MVLLSDTSRAQIDAMEDELNVVTKTQAELQLNVDEAKSKLQSTTTELNEERKNSSKMSMVQGRLYKEFGELVLILQVQCLFLLICFH